MAAMLITLELSTPFADRFAFDIAQILSARAKILISHSSLRPWFYRLVICIIERNRIPRLLDPALHAICSMQDIAAVLQAVNRADSESRLTVWQALLPHVGTFDELDDDRINYILTPIPGLLSGSDIRSAVPDTAFDAWARQSVAANTGYGSRLQALLGNIPPESRKRKRPELLMPTVREQLGLPRSEEDVAKAVSRHLKT